jgi:hypothetical protein
MPDPRIYDLLDFRLPDLSPRTGLYPLPPVGVGTGNIESLTSFITRLAQAHDVSTSALIAKYLRFHLPQGNLAGTLETSEEWKRHFLEDAHTLNGMTDRVSDWVFALEGCTGVGNLQYLTMAVWKGIFSSQGLLRIRRAWCAACYHEWQASGQVIYEPLLWALADVSLCLIHQRTLTQSCPHCGGRPHVLRPRSRPGCCPLCNQWLGSENHQEPGRSSDAVSDRARFMTEGIARLLAITPLLQPPPSKDIMWANLQCCVRDLAEGNAALFGRAAGLSTCVLIFWFTERKLPAFTTLNSLCYRLGIPLFRLLTERLGTGDPDWENARKAVRQYERHAHTNSVDRPALPSPHSALPDISDRKIRKALRSALQQRPLPTIKQIARVLRIKPHRIYTHFPDFYKTLRAARLSHLEAMVKAALLKSPPPTLRDFKKQYGFSRDVVRRRFPGQYRELALRSAQRRYRRREELQSALQAALVEEPPPSGRALAARVGTTHSNLKKVFPEIWSLIVHRYAKHQEQEALGRHAAFSERVRRIATDLLRAGKYPSRRRVLALMRDSELRLEHFVLHEVQLSRLALSST